MLSTGKDHQLDGVEEEKDLGALFSPSFKFGSHVKMKGHKQWRSEGVFLVFWKTPLKMSLKNLLKIIYVAI